ncbi:MAG: UvrD-helicase domain-containing protein [Bacilli bacterium]|nr:UvrD-helicase domain-containing protein [Bacilli bacterium]
MKWTSEQLTAINEDKKSIIVSAGAGSGKTAVLTERVIRKIKAGVNINELLILTFTNKAANEMRERIRKALKGYPELKKQLTLINQAYITTFDSFALSILKKYHYLLNLPKHIDIADDSLIFLQSKEIIENIFEDLYKDKEPNFIKLVNDFCVKDDNDLKTDILSIYHNVSLLINKKDYLDNYINKFFKDDYINKSIKIFEDLIISKNGQISNYLEDISNIDYDYYIKLNETLSPLLEAHNYDEIKQNLQLRLANLPKNSDGDLKYLKENISEIIKDIQEISIYDNIEEIRESILSTEDYTKIIIKIILRLDKELDIYKRTYNLFEFNDISMLLINILENNPDICLEIKKQYQEIMIDEYQDTNDIQEKIIALISDNNVYMVGDIKQSIYRFRNANPYLFKRKYDNYSKDKFSLKIDLNKNFRSREEVLNNINLLFSKLMTASLGGANYNNGHEMVYGNKNYDKMLGNKNYNMNILNYNYDKDRGFTKDELEVFIIANDILYKLKNKYQVVDKETSMLRDCTFKDFAILVDRATNFDLFKKIFEFMKIPLTIYKDENLNSGTEIVVIKNIIKLIIKIRDNVFDTEFKYLFTSIARSFVVAYTDDVIFEMFNNDNFMDNDLYIKLRVLSKHLDTYTNSMLINEILSSFNFFDNLIKLGDVQNRMIRIDYLCDLANNLDGLGFTIEKFSNYLNELIKNDYNIRFSLSKESPNSVQIMTIHASKGLEFSLCYFPLLYKEFNLRDLNEKFLFDKDYGIITPYFKEGIGKTIFKYLLKNKYIEEEISEKIRLFYVALTRAKEQMILVAELNDNCLIKKDKIKFRSFLDMLNFLNDDLKPYQKLIDFNSIYLSHDYNLNKKITDLNKFITNKESIMVTELMINNVIEKKDTYSKANTHFISKQEQKKMQMGTYLHSILENIDFQKKDIDNYEIDSFYKQHIINFLNLDIFNNLDKATIYKEYEFMEICDGIKRHGIIDLMIEYDDYIDIIDYKFKNIDDIAYHKQLLGYKNYIEKKIKKRVNIYLYSILDNKLKGIEQ